MRIAFAASLMAAIFAVQPVSACEWDGPYIPKLPNESEAELKRRTADAYRQEGVMREYRRQKSNYDEASSVFLAEVLDSSKSKDQWGEDDAVAVIKPLKAFKGVMPVAPQKLKSKMGGGLCYPLGDGYGPFARKGDYVIVFTGLKINPYSQPNGTDSMDIRSPLADEIVVALEASGFEDLNP